MKGALVIRIVILLLASVAIAGTLMFAWPTSEPERPAPIASSQPTAPPAPASPPSAPPASAPAPGPSAVDTLKSLADQVGPRTNRTGRAPSFDVARIEPNGDAVIAGRAAPGATVELLRGGVAHDRTTADPSGDFVLVPKPLPPGNYDLTLRATHQDGTASTSEDSVAVELRAGSQDKPVVALTAPDRPAVVLSKPTTDADAAIGLAIDAVEGEAGGRMYVSGRAAPGARVNLYLSDAYIASGTASAEGRIAFSIRSGIRPGDYRVRLDQVDASGRVQKRAEVPFNAPAMLAAPAPPKTQPPGSGPTADTATAASNGADPAPPPAASGGTQPAPPESSQRLASSAPAATPEPAASQTEPAPPGNAAGPAGQPPPSRKPPEPTTSPSAPGDATQSAPGDAPPSAASTPASPPAPTPGKKTEAASTQPPAPAGMTSPTPAVTPNPTVTPRPASPPAPAPGKTEAASTQPPAPAGMTSAPPAATPKPTVTPQPASEPAEQTAVVIIPRVDTAVVTRGDSLWRISRSTYGEGVRYSVIYKANRDQIRDPDLIYPGQIFVLPKEKP